MSENSPISEVHHYTNQKGIEGICRSNKFWATRFDSLNDSSEFRFALQYLRAILKREVFKSIGFHPNTDKVIESIISGAVTITSPLDVRHTVEAFVSSFCMHDDEGIRDHGLLSQWRSYGSDGYSIVFDYKILGKLLEEENEIFSYGMDIKFHKISYKPPSGIPASIKSIIIDFIQNSTPRLDNDFLTDMFTIMGTHKHWGFKEESEIRIIGIPRLEKYHNPKKDKQIKKIIQNEKPRIEIFGRSTLPIKRIIVSPGNNQEQKAESIKRFLSPDIPVTFSEIPYIIQANTGGYNS